MMLTHVPRGRFVFKIAYLYVLNCSWYLASFIKENVKTVITVQVVPAAVKSTHEGVQVLGIVEVKEGKLEDALKRTVSMMVMFQSIPGYRYTTEIHYKVEEALALIGMNLPE